MTIRNLQWSLASVFFLLGGWCLVAPASVAGYRLAGSNVSAAR